jgi:predicted DNA-binding transcriptional regulator YafY
VSNLHRIQWIDAQISAKRYPNCKTIACHFEISTRQASRDIEYLRYSMGAPVDYSAEKNGYFYSNTAFTLPQCFITDEEKMTLAYLADRYNSMKSTHSLRLAELFNKLTGSEQYCGKASVNVPVIDIDPKLAGLFHSIKKAIDLQISIEIQYINSQCESTTRVFHPYKLFRRKQRDYVAGYCMLRQEIRVLRLDRILNIKLTENHFTVSTYFQEEDYDEEMRFTYKTPYKCLIKASHPLQFGKLKSTIQQDDMLYYTVEFFDTNEFIHILLSQPGKFTILFPRWFKEKFIDRLKKIIESQSC